MAGRDRLVALGARRGRRIIAEFGEVLREWRLEAGFSRKRLGMALGISASTLGRWERGEPPHPNLLRAAVISRVLGHDLSVKWFPADAGLRDAGHARLVGAFLSLLPAGTRWRTESPIPITGDLRAWDVLVQLGSVRVGVAAETRLRDWQALLRREERKARDSGVDRLLLVLLNSRANRQAVAEAGVALRAALPLDGRSILPTLRAGRDPGANGLLYMRTGRAGAHVRRPAGGPIDHEGADAVDNRTV